MANLVTLPPFLLPSLLLPSLLLSLPPFPFLLPSLPPSLPPSPSHTCTHEGASHLHTAHTASPLPIHSHCHIAEQPGVIALCLEGVVDSASLNKRSREDKRREREGGERERERKRERERERDNPT
jgi:hypothetical protein